MQDSLTKSYTLILDILHKESDRGVILVIATMIENVLVEGITSRLLDPVKKAKEDELLSLSSPLNNFSSRIDLAYRVGVITLAEREIYHQLRQIRNKCAHQVEYQDFSLNHFESRISNMIKASPEIWNVFKEKLKPPQLQGKSFDTVEEYIDTIGKRIALETFFALIISHKKLNLHRIPKISDLSKPNG